MERTAIILLYVGTILIGFQYVSKMSYVQRIVFVLFFFGILSLFKRPYTHLSKEHSEKGKILIAGFHILVALLVILQFILASVAAIVLSPFVLIELLIGTSLMWLNSELNKVQKKGMKLIIGLLSGKPRDQGLSLIDQENEVPFLALFGVVCVTVGFILRLTQ